MLVRRDALHGGRRHRSIRDALIDDCALGARSSKRSGRSGSASPSACAACGPIRIRRHPPHGLPLGLRPARYSPLLLAGTVVGMTLTYLVPPSVRSVRASGSARCWSCRLCADGAGLPADLALLSSLALLGPGAAGHRPRLYGFHARFRLSALARHAADCGRGACRRRCRDADDDHGRQNASGKSHRDENFPVASALIHPRHRASFSPSTASRAPPTTSPIILAARRRKARAISTRMEDTLLGRSDADRRTRLPLRAALAERDIGAAPRAGSADRLPHGRDQAALSRLGRPDRLLHAIRPCRSAASCSMCMARAARPGRQRRTLRGAADHQSSAGLRRGLSRHSTASIFRSMRSIAPARPWRHWRRTRASPALLQCIRTARGAHVSAAERRRTLFRRRSAICRLGLEVAVIQRLAGGSLAPV